MRIFSSHMQRIYRRRSSTNASNNSTNKIYSCCAGETSSTYLLSLPCNIVKASSSNAVYVVHWLGYSFNGVRACMAYFLCCDISQPSVAYFLRYVISQHGARMLPFLLLPRRQSMLVWKLDCWSSRTENCSKLLWEHSSRNSLQLRVIAVLSSSTFQLALTVVFCCANNQIVFSIFSMRNILAVLN